MNGIRLPRESSEGLTRQLEVTMESLRPHLEPLHWILDADFRSVALDGTPFPEGDESDLLGLGWSGARVARPGFFPRCARFVVPDWTELVGLAASPDAPPLHQGRRVDLRAMARGGVFYASCVDGAYWEVYSASDGWLLRLRTEFPTAAGILLDSTSA